MCEIMQPVSSDSIKEPLLYPKPGSLQYAFEQRSRERLFSSSILPKPTNADCGGEWMLPEYLVEVEDRRGWLHCQWNAFTGALRSLPVWIAELWNFGRSDPRKVIFAAKASLALAIVCLLIFLDMPELGGLTKHVVWPIVTVVVVFEFSIGATLSKGFNRGLGTLTAGGLALLVAELSALTGPCEEAVIVISIILMGFLASFIKLYPSMKPYEYGVRVFLLTYCFILVSGFRTKDFMETATSRFLLIALGAVVGVGVNVCIYPIWAGEDLHNLVAKNFSRVAESLEGCMDGYLQCLEYSRISSKILTYQASDDPLYSGYRTVVESTSTEDNLLGFAVWEPPHGPYKMLNYPWKYYTRLGGALRHCAFTVMALHGCILSEIQAPPESRNVFKNEMHKVGSEGAKVLYELGNRVKTMTKLDSDNFLLGVAKAAEDLQKKIDRKSYLLVHPESWEVKARGNLDYAKIREEEISSSATSSYIQAAAHDAGPSANGGGDNTGLRPEAMLEQKVIWPPRQSFMSDSGLPTEEMLKAYESASSLTLATFASLLIEFVARLHNLVDAFKELSDKANFKEPMTEPKSETDGLWNRIKKFLFR